MTQTDMNLANLSASAARTDINNHLAAIASNNAATTEPTIKFAHMWWFDETTNLLKARNKANSAWIVIGKMDETNGRFELRSNVLQAITTVALAVKNSTGTKLLDLIEATSLQATTGTNQYAIMTPRRVREAVPFSRGFTSSAQTITASGSLTIAHGLGGYPSQVGGWLQCVVDDFDYVVGDRIYSVGWNSSDSGSNKMNTLMADASNLTVLFSGSSKVFATRKRLAGGVQGLTNASWQLYITAWL